MSTVEFDGDERAGAPALDTAAAPPKVQPEAAAVEAAVPAAKRAAVYTMMAHQAVNIAELLNRGLAKKTIGKSEPRRVEVAEPSGPSTSGGKRARQSINLVPVSGEGGVVMCGWLDIAKKSAQLRSFQEVSALYKKRFGTKFEPSADEYGKLMKDLEIMLQTMAFTLVVAVDDDDEEEAKSGGDKGGGKGIRVVAAAVAFVVVSAIIFLLK